MELSQDDVAKVAELARLELAGEELELMASQLATIVGFVEKLAEVETEGVEEMAHPLDLHSVLRDDENRPSISREQALSNAPNQDGEFFLVPAVMAR